VDLELDRGRGVPYEGNYSGWLQQKSTRMAQEEKQASARQRTLARELEWVRMSPRARQSKSKARIQKYEELASDTQFDKIAQNEIVIPPAPRLGNDVVNADNLKKAYGDKLLFDGLTFSLPRGGLVGVIGPNGAGKTTLFRMIVGSETPRRWIAQGRRDGAARVRRSEPHARPEQERLGNDLGRARTDHGREARDQQSARISRASTSGARTSRRRSERCPAVNETACTSRARS
jgi:ATPase subunit of ABC transporter with duplicated ATPase domains